MIGTWVLGNMRLIQLVWYPDFGMVRLELCSWKSVEAGCKVICYNYIKRVWLIQFLCTFRVLAICYWYATCSSPRKSCINSTLNSVSSSNSISSSSNTSHNNITNTSSNIYISISTSISLVIVVALLVTMSVVISVVVSVAITSVVASVPYQ